MENFLYPSVALALKTPFFDNNNLHACSVAIVENGKLF
jgi:hypothetical protein